MRRLFWKQDNQYTPTNMNYKTGIYDVRLSSVFSEEKIIITCQVHWWKSTWNIRTNSHIFVDLKKAFDRMCGLMAADES